LIFSRAIRSRYTGTTNHLTVCALVCTIFQHMVLTFASKHSIAFRWLLDIIFISCSVSPQHLISAKVFLLFFSTRTVVYVIPWMHFVYLYYRNERISWERRREKRKSEASKHAKQVLFLDLEDLHYFRQTHTPQKAVIAYLPFIPPTKWRESILVPNIWINLPQKTFSIFSLFSVLDVTLGSS